MYYGAVPATFQKARQLRNKMTSAEKLLWERLKGKQICNAKQTLQAGKMQQGY
jgi:very-short-patch-repair endonuclease